MLLHVLLLLSYYLKCCCFWLFEQVKKTMLLSLRDYGGFREYEVNDKQRLKAQHWYNVIMIKSNAMPYRQVASIAVVTSSSS